MISADSTFQLRYIHYFLDTVLLYHNRLQYSVITTFICSGKPTNRVTHFIMTFTLLRSSGTKPTVSPRSASAVLGLVTQSYPTLCNPMDYTVHGILQASHSPWSLFDEHIKFQISDFSFFFHLFLLVEA